MIYKNMTALITGASGGLGEECVHAAVALTHAFVPDMIASRRGGLINIASTASFQPLAGAAVYAAP